MKSNFKSILFLSVSIISCFSACKKYEEGPFISLKTKKERVCAEWTISEYTLASKNLLNTSEEQKIICNNNQNLSLFNSSQTVYTYLDFDRNGKYHRSLKSTKINANLDSSAKVCTPIYIESEVSEDIIGSWNFGDDKESIIISFEGGATEKWEIIELREKRMKLRSNSPNGTFELILNKIEIN